MKISLSPLVCAAGALGLAIVSNCAHRADGSLEPIRSASGADSSPDLVCRDDADVAEGAGGETSDLPADVVRRRKDGEENGDVTPRLAPKSCRENEAEVRAARIATMRAEVEEEWKRWRAQSRCVDRNSCVSEEEATRSPRPAPPPPNRAPQGYALFDQGWGRGTLSPAPATAAAPPSAALLGAMHESVARPAPVSNEAAPKKAESASGTNNQVAGVDEADIVKNDGTYVYLASNGALRIVEALRPRLLSVTPVSGTVREMLVERDRAVLFVGNGGTVQKQCKYAYDCEVGSDGTSTSVLVFDIADRRHPKRVREINLSGSLLAARRIGDTVHTVVADNGPAKRGASYPTTLEDWDGSCSQCVRDAEQVHARFEALKRRNEARILAEPISFPTITENGVAREMCDVMHGQLADSDSFTSIVSFDLNSDASPAQSATLESRPGTVFASEKGLYVAVTHHKSDNPRRWYTAEKGESEVSDIHKFRIGAHPGMTKYVGSGVVPGHVLNQLAMDEYQGYLRVATTRGKVPNPDVSSSISVMAETKTGSLVRVGSIDHIAPSEDIRAVRFDDDRGYIVTFKKTDPLFVVDLSRATAPQILGELKIPGFSTYLHRIDPTHLLSIGFDANDHGNFAYFDGLLLQLFDVTNPTDPKLLHREKIGSRGSSSEAAADHLAFNYMHDRGLLAIPVTTCEGGGDGRFGNQLTFSGLAVYNVSTQDGFRRLGGVDHGTRGANCNTWWANAQSMVKRSIFMDDLVFSIADDRVKVQRLSELGSDVADIPLVNAYLAKTENEEPPY